MSSTAESGGTGPEQFAPGVPRRPALDRRDWAYIAALVLWVLLSRIPYVSDFAEMSRDGSRYVNSLGLDHSYNVPMPGNLGFVLLAKGLQIFWKDPVHAYAAANILLGCLAVGFIYLLGTLLVPRALSAAATLALSCNTVVWWHGTPLTSYNVWLAVLPALAWFGVRYVREGRRADLVGASLALGLGTVLRQDLVAFGGPLWAGCLLLGRAKLRDWLLGLGILTTCCLGWFLGTSVVLGGSGEYLAQVAAKHRFHKEFSPEAKGLFEGLGRNGSKYVLFLVWGAHLALLPFLWGVWLRLRALRQHWRALVLATLWVGPSWYFALFVFAGTAGLIFPVLPLVYLGASWALHTSAAARWKPLPAAAMLGLALLGALQFNLSPLLAETDQRRVILNVTFLKYTGEGLRRQYNHNLVEYGIAGSLRSVLRQMRTPEPVPERPGESTNRARPAAESR